jgi:probable HAF family extracellular repeat protein
LKTLRTACPRWLLAIALVVISIPGAQKPASAQAFKIIDIGLLPGRTHSYALGINSAGEVCGESNITDAAGNHYRAFLWLPAAAYGLPAGLNDIGTLGGDDSTPWDLNDFGQVVGSSSTLGDASFRGFLWQNGAFTALSTLGGSYSEAGAINNAGQIVGDARTPAEQWHAAIWNGGVVTDLDPTSVESVATYINSVGRVVGYRKGADGVFRAVVWSGGMMKFIGGLGGTSSAALGNNDLDQIVGIADLPGDLVGHAFRYSGGVMKDLGVPAGYLYSGARRINLGGLIAGWADNGAQDPYTYPTGHAVVWQGTKMLDLNKTLPPGSPWELVGATDVNDSGQIVGWGVIGGQTHGFVMSPAAHLLKIAVSPSSVVGCKPALGTVTLASAAPTGGAVVYLSTTNSAVSVPQSVIVPEGKTSKSFTIRTKAVTAIKSGLVTATLGLESKTASISLRPIGVQSLTLVPSDLIGGEPSTGIVVLQCPAAPGDIVVTLTSSNPAVATVPASITIPFGSSFGAFAIDTSKVADFTAVTITAKANGTFKAAILTVYP